VPTAVSARPPCVPEPTIEAKQSPDIQLVRHEIEITVEGVSIPVSFRPPPLGIELLGELKAIKDTVGIYSRSRVAIVEPDATEVSGTIDTDD
jgi:hypothetical protein